MDKKILTQIDQRELERLLEDRSGKFHGPFDKLEIGNEVVNNVFIRLNNGKLQVTDRVPFKVGGVIIQAANRRRLANSRSTNKFFLPTKTGASLIAIEYPSNIKVYQRVDADRVGKIKEEHYRSIGKCSSLEDLKDSSQKIQLLLDKNERVAFSNKIRDRMKELIERHNLEKAKGTKKTMVTLSDQTVKYMKSVIENEKTIVKQKDIDRKESKKHQNEHQQSLSERISPGH